MFAGLFRPFGAGLLGKELLWRPNPMRRRNCAA